jgi:hypothetical protein
MPRKLFPHRSITCHPVGFFCFKQSSLWFALVCLISAAGVTAATSVNGTQTGKWSLADSPYQATQDIYVPPGQTLTIEAGVVVEFTDPQVGLIIDGTLLARGNSQQPILFTSSQAQKAAGQWKGLIFRDPSDDASNILEHCIIEYAGAGGITENVRIENAAPTLLRCMVRNSSMHGILLLNADPRIEECSFQANGGANTNAYARFFGVGRSHFNYRAGSSCSVCFSGNWTPRRWNFNCGRIRLGAD